MSADLPEREQRFHPRRSLRVAARLVQDGQPALEVRTRDVSEGGLGLVSEANPRPGTRFRVWFTLPDHLRTPVLIDADATVVRSILAKDEGGFKIGLLFKGLDEPSAKAIRRYIGRA